MRCLLIIGCGDIALRAALAKRGSLPQQLAYISTSGGYGGYGDCGV